MNFWRRLAGLAAAGWMSVTTAAPAGPVSPARIEPHPAFRSTWVAAREVDVWLPPGYDGGDRRYPVVYLHDGQNLFNPATSYTGVPWGVDRAMQGLIREGTTPGVILVGIWNTPHRFEEYLPQKAVTTDAITTGVPGLPPLHRAELKADAYLRFIVSELKPVIDRTYRTRPDRDHTFIMGSSMGGLISAYAVAEYPETFGGAGCLSTHWPAADGATIPYLKTHLPKSGHHRFYFDYGTETLDAGYEPYQRRVDAILRAAGYREGVDWVTRKFPGADHSERAWSRRVEIPLRFLTVMGP